MARPGSRGGAGGAGRAGGSARSGGWPPASKPRRVDGGIRARSRRGPIGETWWSQRFLAVLESFHMGGRLERGRRYARAGQVLDLDVAPGLVTASVQGSRAKPYRVLIGVEQLSARQWVRVEKAMAARAVFLARLLAGDMPEEIEEAFAACSLSVFPRSAGDLDTACSCPDWANPCKHVAATYYLLAEAFDRDPFLMLAWRGRRREELLAGLRALRGGPGAGAGHRPSLAPGGPAGRGDSAWAGVEEVGRTAGGPGWLPDGAGAEAFWLMGPQAAAVKVRPRAAVVPDAILRQLDPLAAEVRGTGVAELLAGAYPSLTAGAAARAVSGAGGDALSVTGRNGGAGGGVERLSAEG